MWVAIAAAAVVIVALAVAIPIILLERGDQALVTSTETTVALSSTTSSERTTTTELLTSTTSSTEESTTTTAATLPGPPGDSAGHWVEKKVPGVPVDTSDFAISDQVFAYVKYAGGRPRLFAYLFETGETLQIPVQSGVSGVGGLDLDGPLLVWREVTCDADNEVVEADLYACRLPSGPKTLVVSDLKLGYPRVAGSLVAWTLIDTWAPRPDELALIRIWGAGVDERGRPTGAAAELVSGALAYIMGDSVWSYSLSPTHLSWETHEAIDTFDPGTYVMDFEDMQPSIVSPEAFSGSLGDKVLVYQEAGQLKLLDLVDGETRVLDTQGLLPSAAPTYAAYYRSTRSGDCQVVARGFTGSYEQILAGRTGEVPECLPAISTSPHRLAFMAEGKVRTLVWQPE
jgi:hypothetical protein